jgi:hypothetical protein
MNQIAANPLLETFKNFKQFQICLRVLYTIYSTHLYSLQYNNIVSREILNTLVYNRVATKQLKLGRHRFCTISYTVEMQTDFQD